MKQGFTGALTGFARIAAAAAISLGVAAGAIAEPSKGAPGSAATASNPLDQPMVFSIVRSNAGFCEPLCPEWIYAEGQIVADTPAAFKEVLARAGDRKLPLLVVSPGGNVASALEMGRIIRKRGIAVEVSATRFADCSPRQIDCESGPVKGEFRGTAFAAGAFCWSACPLLLAAGERRISSAWSFTGVHQITTTYSKQKVYFRERYKIVNGKKKVVSRKIIKRQDAGIETSTKLPKKTRKALLSYFRDMGVAKGLLDVMLSTPPDQIRRLQPAEMLDLKLITELAPSDLLANPAVCEEATPAANCIRRDDGLTRPGQSRGGAPGQG